MDPYTNNTFVITPPWSRKDLRNHPRIVKTLTETGKLVP